MPLTLKTIPGFSDLKDAVLVADDPGRGLHAEEISSNAEFAMCRMEIFQGMYINGDTVPLPVSGIDDYHYAPEELLYLWNPDLSTDKSSGWFPSGSGSLFFCNWLVDQATAQVFSTEVYRNNGSGGSRTQTNAGQIHVYTVGQRQRTNILMATSPAFSVVNPADIALDKPWEQSLAQGLNDNAKFAVLNKECFYCGEFINGQQIPRGAGSALISPIDGYQYQYAECHFVACWRWTTDGTTFTEPPEQYGQLGPFMCSIDASGNVSITVITNDNDGNVTFPSGFGRIAAFAFCTRSATPASAPLANSFAEIPITEFIPGHSLRASTALAIKKNIDEALLTPEFFGPTEYANGSTVPTPTSPVDGYAYARSELTYVWSWSSTLNFPSTGGRLPVFYGAVNQTTGAVNLAAWRLASHYVDDHNELPRIKVLVVARRQQTAPALLDSTAANPPSDVLTVSGNPAIPIQINGVDSAEVTNFNDTTPAAPSGTPVKWQKGASTSPCEVSAYVDLTLPLFVGGETPAGTIDGSNLEFDLQYAPAVYTPIAGETTDNGWLILQVDDKLLAPNGTGLGTGVGFNLFGAHISLNAGYAPVKSIVAWYIRRPAGNAAPAGVKAAFTENNPTASP